MGRRGAAGGVCRQPGGRQGHLDGEELVRVGVELGGEDALHGGDDALVAHLEVALGVRGDAAQGVEAGELRGEVARGDELEDLRRGAEEVGPRVGEDGHVGDGVNAVGAHRGRLAFDDEVHEAEAGSFLNHLAPYFVVFGQVRENHGTFEPHVG